MTHPEQEALSVSEGWVPWHGGDNPVPGQWVEVRFVGGGSSRGISDTWTAQWHDAASPCDICAYRPASEASQ